MKVTFLGTGTSTGIPQIGCKCEVCSSTDEKDKRLRSSVLIQEADTNIIIDCGPDFRQQLLRHPIKHLEGVFITHEHYDHIAGLDDIRPLGKCVIYAENRVLSSIRHNLPYAFSDNPYPGVPKLTLSEIEPDSEIRINNLIIQPIRLMHARLPILGFRIGKFAYLTDVKTITKEAIEQLQGLNVLVLNALRHQEHIAHITLNEAIELSREINPQTTYFTHFSHDLGFHHEIQKILPKNMYLAYDNLEILV